MRLDARHRSPGGQITVIFVAGLVTFLGMLALAVDVGFFYGTKARLQGAVDIGLLLAFAQVNPSDPYEQQVQSLKEKVDQFQKANFSGLSQENISAANPGERPWALFEVQPFMDPTTQRLVRAEAQGTVRVGTWFSRVFGQESVDIGVRSVVEGARVYRQDQPVMEAHIVD